MSFLEFAELNFCQIIGILQENFKKRVEAFLAKISSFRNELGVNQK